ncbi:hypothetical protein H0H87_011236 [Tephrocybe sp. NHM501043]|nr:hypothetical protein H0H87_011236 [Tephrocybe sp. NHM501043]
MDELIMSRAFAGIGGGGMQTIVSIIVSDVVPLRSRGTWQGVLNIIWTMGSASGAPLGGFLADSIGWRWAFLLQVPLTLLAIASVTFGLHLPKTDSSNFSAKLKRVDFAGSLVLIITVFSLLFSLDRGGNISWTDNLTLFGFGSFMLFFILFGIIETRIAKEPFAPKRIIFNQSLIAGYLVNFFGIAAGMSMIFHVSLYLQAVHGDTASEAGLWLVLSVLGGLVGSLSGGLAIQATGKFYLLTVAGYAMQFLGTGVIAVTTRAAMKTMIPFGLGLLISSIGNGSGITTSLIALIANAGPEDQAIATAVSYLFRSLGSVVGVSVGSTVVQETLRTYLRRNLSGENVEEVCNISPSAEAKLNKACVQIILRVRESLDYINKLEPATQLVVKTAYSRAVQATFTFTVAMASLALLSSVFIKEAALESKFLITFGMKSEALVDPTLLLPEDSPQAQKEKKGALQTITDLRRALAWELARWPLAKNVHWDRGRIHLPRSYLSRDGEDTRIVHPGTDLNHFVHQYYLEEIDAKVNDWINYVHMDKVVAKRFVPSYNSLLSVLIVYRHEYLGPSPRVAGYFVDVDGDIYIKWWDSFLSDQWMGTQKWKVETMWNGEKWVEKNA